MTTHRALLAYLLVAHATALAAAIYFLRERPGWLIGAEAALVVSLAVALSLWRRTDVAQRLLRDGTAALRDQDYSLRLRETGTRDVDELIDVYNDLLARIRAERLDNRRRERFLDLLVESAELGVIALDFDGDLARVNAWGRRQLGLRQNEPLPSDLAAIDHPLARAVADLPPGERRLVRLPDHRRYRCEASTFVDRGFARRFIVVADLSGELAAAEVGAYGQVIRMMAHEVNNATAATRSLLESLLASDDLDDADFRSMTTEYLPLVAERGEAMNAFMRRFAEVVRVPEPRLADTDLGTLLRGQAALARPVCAEAGIAVDDSAVAPVRVRADAALLERVVANALVNARESIAAAREGGEPGGTIRLATTRSPPGFVVADDGAGIDPALAERLFTPFFSTKPTGQGVGLTLMRDVLERHGASYALATEDDGWTRLRVGFGV